MTNLPLINVPKHRTVLPCSGKEIEYRPFLVKEEKILILAAESGEENAVEDAVLQVVENCTFNKVDIEKLPRVDLEWILLQLRKRSKGGEIHLFFKCGKLDENEKECNHTNEFFYNVDDIKYVGPDSKGATIKLIDDIGVKMKIPTVEDSKKIRLEDSLEGIFDTLIASIEMIYKGDVVWQVKDISREEVEEFLESLPTDQLKKIQTFIDNLPRLVLEVDFTCSKCGYKEKIELSGLDSFFV